MAYGGVISAEAVARDRVQARPSSPHVILLGDAEMDVYVVAGVIVTRVTGTSQGG